MKSFKHFMLLRFPELQTFVGSRKQVMNSEFLYLQNAHHSCVEKNYFLRMAITFWHIPKLCTTLSLSDRRKFFGEFGIKSFDFYYRIFFKIPCPTDLRKIMNMFFLRSALDFFSFPFPPSQKILLYTLSSPNYQHSSRFLSSVTRSLSQPFSECKFLPSSLLDDKNFLYQS